MIAARLERAMEQTATTAAFEKAYRFLMDSRGRSLEAGRIEIDGDRVYALVQDYETKAGGEAQFEAHRKYADIQCIVSGEEAIGWAPVELMAVTQGYDPAKDVVLGTVPPGEATLVRLRAGEVGVFYPSDAHAPKLAAGSPTRVVKIVVKVEVGT
jgi:YhcH/YjgK/YiaL family protein